MHAVVIFFFVLCTTIDLISPPFVCLCVCLFVFGLVKYFHCAQALVCVYLYACAFYSIILTIMPSLIIN